MINIILESQIKFQLIFNEGLGDWREVNTGGAQIQAVTAADLRKVAVDYFKKENRAVAVYTRKAGAVADAEDPDMSGLTPEQKPVARQIAAALRAETDLEGMKQKLAQMETALASADPKKQPLQKFIVKKIIERVSQLSAK